MIAPEKFSRSIANTKLSFGLSVYEMVVCGFIPFLLSLLGIEFLFANLGGLVVALVLIARTKLLKRNFISNLLLKKSAYQWQRIERRD